MHVFIDTNIFEQDPYWKNSFAKILIEHAKQNKINLYLSKIAYEELRLHTLRNHKKTIKALNAGTIEHNRFRKENIELNWSSDTQVEFVSFYQELEKEYGFKLLGYDNISFEKVMDRLLKREKPFNEDKPEIKDCGIWLTYAEYAESKNLTDCFILSNNKKDFYEKTPITENPTEYMVHSELVRDSKKFRGFPSIKDFIQAVIEPQIQASARFQAWLDTINIDNIFTFDLLRSEAGKDIESKINGFVNHLDIMTVFDERELHFVGEVLVNDLEWWDCQDIEKVVLENAVVVSAVLNFKLVIEGHAFNPSYDGEDNKYYSLGEKEIDLNMIVSFTLKEGGKVESFDITDVEL